jgi:hypothetical protein
MGLNRQLIDSIKKNFSQKSTADLEEIVRLKDLDRWSEEAFVAAEEVLAERGAGRAQEPRVPVKDTPPLSLEEWWNTEVPYCGFVTELSEGQIANRPVPFGSNIAWLAAETTNTPAVVVALGLQKLRVVTWKEGVAAASRSAVFVTPPLGDWTLAVSTTLVLPERVDAVIKPVLEELSRHFRDAQYFCTQQESELHTWARAQKGRLLRGYGWLGREHRTLWNEGPQSKEERALGFRFTDGPTTPPVVTRAEDPTTADESCVLQLAALWSVDPTTLDKHFAEPAAGILGDVPQRWHWSSWPST